MCYKLKILPVSLFQKMQVIFFRTLLFIQFAEALFLRHSEMGYQARLSKNPLSQRRTGFPKIVRLHRAPKNDLHFWE